MDEVFSYFKAVPKYKYLIISAEEEESVWLDNYR